MRHVRMSEADREQYGGPEWLDFADVVEWCDTAGYDQLADVEKQIQTALDDKAMTLLYVVGQMMGRTRQSTAVPMRRVRMWLGLVAAGVQLPLADFKPRVFAADWAKPKEQADADPPSNRPDSSTSTTADTPPSPPSTEASTAGPASPTE